MDRVRETVHNDTAIFITGVIIAVFAIFMFCACISFLFTGGADQSVADAAVAGAEAVSNAAGRSGASLSEWLVNKQFGLASFILLLFMLVLGLHLMKLRHFRIGRWFVSCIFLTIWVSVLLSAVLTPFMESSFFLPGGSHGLSVQNWLVGAIGYPGLVLVLLLTMLLYCVWLTRRTIEWIRNVIGLKKKEKDPEEDDNEETDADTENAEAQIDTVYQTPEPAAPANENNFEDEDDDEEEEVVEGPAPEKPSKGKSSDNDKEEKENEIELEVNEATKEEEYEGKIPEPYNPRLDLSHYKFPSPDLLNYYEETAPTNDRDEQEANKNRIIQVLRNFGIEIKSISATPGPTVTLFEITPADGVRISKIRGLEDDIALSLAALGIRIIAPIPGKGTIGIEVPNAKPVIVPMQSIIKSKKFVESTYELPVALGKTITNEIFMFDLAKMPHLLVAGATGMGKSVGLNAIVASLLYKKHPAELKLVMVDPKMVEFSIYSKIEKHFLAKLPDNGDAIITDTSKVVKTLKSLCIEMDARYELLKDAGVRSVVEYNKLFTSRQLNPQKGHRYMPYIVVVIDEFGDLIMTAGKDIETPIARIAQKARAVGMHMIIATQRPTTNIITGNIKANFPARIAFRVTQMIDSRTILDRPGANQLIGRGDMLFFQGGDPIRVQCAFIDTPEVVNICNYISTQQSYVSAYELPEVIEDTDAAAGGEALSKGDLDPLFEDAARLIVTHQQGSTSLIQRKFAIGYNRAGRLMDQLERAGVVGPAEGSKPRQVLCMDDTELDMKIQNMN